MTDLERTLLEALENLEDVIESHIGNDDETERRLKEALVQAREAIAVAYGEVVQ